MQDTTHSRKRRRATSDPHLNLRPQLYTVPVPVFDLAPPANLQRDPEFWFEDGSVVLIAQNIGFRVYKRLLLEHSSVFHDLFQVPQPPNAPTVDGCPFVFLPDHAWELRYLLRALFPTKGNLTFGARQDTLTMDALSAVLRLAHKYQVDQLMAQAISHLTEYYTDDFRDWINLERTTCLEADYIDAITAINLAHLTNTPSILPLAYLDACEAGSALFDGCVRGGAYVEGLPIKDLRHIMDGKAAVLTHCSKAIARIFSPEPSETCTSNKACMRALVYKASELDEMLRLLTVEGMARCWANEFRLDTGSGWTICEECRDMVQERDLEERRDFWKALPGMFNLHIEGWQ